MVPPPPFQHQKHSSPSSFFESNLEKQVERQNQILSQVLFTMNQQNKLDQQQSRFELNQKIKELEMNKLQTDLELEKQMSRRKERETQRETRNHPPPPIKREKSDLKGALYKMILRQKKGSNSVSDTIEGLILSHNHSHSPKNNILQTDLGQRIQSEPNNYYSNSPSSNHLYIPLEDDNPGYATLRNSHLRTKGGTKSFSKNPSQADIRQDLPSITELTPRRSQFDTSIILKSENSPSSSNTDQRKVNFDFSNGRRFAAVNNQLVPPQFGSKILDYREPLVSRSKSKRKTRRARTRTDIDDDQVDNEASNQRSFTIKIDKKYFHIFEEPSSFQFIGRRPRIELLLFHGRLCIPDCYMLIEKMQLWLKKFTPKNKSLRISLKLMRF